MSIRVAYGKREDIPASISSGEIPKGCLIVTKNDTNRSEFLFYDTAGVLKDIQLTEQFESFTEAEAYVKQYELMGKVISILEGGLYKAYLVQDDNTLTPLESEAFITCTSGEFTVSDSKRLFIQKISMEKVTGLAEALASKVNSEEFELHQEEVRTILEEYKPYITCVNVDEFSVNNNTGRLSVGTIGMDKITGLPEALAGKVEVAEFNTKVNGLETTRIAKVKLNGTPLNMDNTDQSVDIPLASSVNLGFVVASRENNKVFINDDGTMTINPITFSNLVQGESTIVLNGGNAEE